MIEISLLALAVCLVPLAYYYLLAFASTWGSCQCADARDRTPATRFLIALAAHDEAAVIANTMYCLQALDYPPGLYGVHLVADHCTDDTARLARGAGAFAHERDGGPATGKGAALCWLFDRILDDRWDAVVILDADTCMDPQFLRIMDSRLAQGEQVIQGHHIIRNPQDGWFPALTWAMFLIDNRFQNLGRCNLGWSAKHMGDSICFRASVLREFCWEDGLTDDFRMRQKLLLGGIKIGYEPAARGFGEAPRSLAQARAQRARWLRGTREACRQCAWRLLLMGLRTQDAALLDGALQAYLPSYSTLTLTAILAAAPQILVNWVAGPVFPVWLIASWLAVAALLFSYPFLGLALQKAPLRAYVVILLGPFFVLWRTWLALKVRYFQTQVKWVRTAHGGQV